METRDGLPTLTQLFPKDNNVGNTTIDIIAVHGIETQSPRTWTCYERDEEPRGRATNWLRDEDMLPKVLPQARIWVYDYNSNCYSDNAQEIDILALGDTFLEILKGYQEQGIGDGERMLVFIGSCFGGIVIAQALVRASQNRARYRRLIDSTGGVIFLGTPFRGTRSAGIAQWLVSIRAFMGRETSKTLLEGLRERDNTLNNTIHEFAEMVIQDRVQIQICCFYETRQSQIAKAVVSRMVASFVPTVKLFSKESACLDGHKRIPLEATHSKMNKFRNPDDGSFRLVSGFLKELVDDASFHRSLPKKESQCLQSLASDYEGEKNKNPQRVPGTCMWLLEHPKYLDWLQDRTASMLWVSADPGCGKSVLSRALVDEGFLKPNPGATSICYYFFKDDDSDRQDGAKAICAILHQLFIQKPVLLYHATRSFQDHGVRLCTLFGALWRLLETSAADPEAGEIVCVLDALDECGEEARKELIRKLTHFYSSHGKSRTSLKFLLTSRPYANIEREFHRGIKDMTSMRLRGEEEMKQISKEIDLVIDIRVPHICGAREPPFELEVQQALISSLKRFQNRTYLWLHLTLEVIEDTLESTMYDLEVLINRLPQRIEDAYEGILKKINGSGYVKDARSLLHIVVAAIRPLTLGEIQIALALSKKIEHGEHCESYNDLVLQSEDAFRVKLRNLCGLFLSIVDSKVYLIHQTAKEFLISKNSNDRSVPHPKSTSEVWRHSLSPVESNLILLKICLSYLLLCGADGEMIFLHYAVCWIAHFQSAGSRIDESMLQSTLSICEPRSPAFSKWWPRNHPNLKHDIPRYQAECTNSWTSLMVVSWIGLDTMTKFLLGKNSANLNTQNKDGQTALHIAVTNRHPDVVKVLVEENGIALNLTNHLGFAPLHIAAQMGPLEVIRLLVEKQGVELNLRDDRGRTPLCTAVNEGHTEIVRLLAETQSVDPNLKDERGQTPLLIAASKGRTGLVRLLVEKRGIALDLQDQSGITPLYIAAFQGYTEIVNVLVEKENHVFDFDRHQGLSLYGWGRAKGYIKLPLYWRQPIR